VVACDPGERPANLWPEPGATPNPKDAGRSVDYRSGRTPGQRAPGLGRPVTAYSGYTLIAPKWWSAEIW
jgi:hypothetical protein